MGPERAHGYTRRTSYPHGTNPRTWTEATSYLNDNPHVPGRKHVSYPVRITIVPGQKQPPSILLILLAFRFTIRF